MELWIRSQDKEKLLKVNEIHLGLNKQYVDSDIWVNNWIVGEYATKERALKVLDEIQKLLMPISEYKQEVDNLIINYKNIDTAIYEMPEE